MTPRAPRSGLAVVVAGLVGLGLLACATGPVPVVGEPPPAARDPAAEKRWQEIFAKYSDRAQIYDGLDTRLFVAASWQSNLFVTARVERDAAFRAVALGETPVMLEAERLRLADLSEFFMGVHVNESKFDDFDQPSSIWTVTLTACLKDYPAKSIARVGRATLNMRAIYSYMDTFWVGYRVQFPKVTGCNDEKIYLRIASSLGIAHLEFARE